MYKVSKRIEVAGSHRLELDYDSPCSRLHGHNWIITVHCQSPVVNQNGMVIDFARIKKLVHGKMDHQNLNELFSFNPTAENIAKWIYDTINADLFDTEAFCYKVEVQESEGNVACYEE